jgi:S1-C subfamily serine protease
MGIMPDYLYDGSGLKIDGVSENRPADNAGLIKGDVVVKIGDIKVNSMQDYMKVLSVSNKGDQLKIEFIRDGKLKKSKVIFD